MEAVIVFQSTCPSTSQLFLAFTSKGHSSILIHPINEITNVYVVL